jgi:hypothetical protein
MVVGEPDRKSEEFLTFSSGTGPPADLHSVASRAEAERTADGAARERSSRQWLTGLGTEDTRCVFTNSVQVAALTLTWAVILLIG